MADLLLGYLTADAADAGAALVAAALVLLSTGWHCNFQATAAELVECWVGQSMRVLRTEGEGAGGREEVWEVAMVRQAGAAEADIALGLVRAVAAVVRVATRQVDMATFAVAALGCAAT